MERRDGAQLCDKTQEKLLGGVQSINIFHMERCDGAVGPCYISFSDITLQLSMWNAGCSG